MRIRIRTKKFRILTDPDLQHWILRLHCLLQISLIQVTLTGQGDNTDHNAVGAAVNTISTNLPDMAREVKMLAALMDDRGTEGDDLMGAARTLCGAFSDMLRAAEPQTNEVRKIITCQFLRKVDRLPVYRIQ